MLHQSVCNIEKSYLNFHLIFVEHPFTSFNFCLFTWVAYLVTFRIEMTWTIVSWLFALCLHYLVYMHCLICHVSLVIAVPGKPF